MLFYAVVLTITTALAWLYTHVRTKQQQIVMRFLLIMVPTTVAGLRGVGTDIRHYINYADEIVAGTYEYVDYKSIFVQLVRFLLGNNIHFQVVLFVISFITIYLMFAIFEIYKENISFSFAVFSYMLVFYQMSFNTYRQNMAAAIFLLASVYLFKMGDKKRFFILYALAGLIHSSLLPFGLVFFLRNLISRKKHLKDRVLIYILATFGIFAIPILTSQMLSLRTLIPHYEWYVSSFKLMPLGFGLLRYFVMGIVPLLYVHTMSKDDGFYEQLSFLPFYVSMGFVLWLTSYVSETSLYRISYNLLIALPLFHGFMLKRILKTRWIMVLSAAIVIMLFFWLYDGMILNTGETVPYKLGIFLS